MLLAPKMETTYVRHMEPVLDYFFFQLDVIHFFNFFIFGLFVETVPFMRVVNFVSVFYFLKPAEQSPKRKLTCSSWLQDISCREETRSGKMSQCTFPSSSKKCGFLHGFKIIHGSPITASSRRKYGPVARVTTKCQEFGKSPFFNYIEWFWPNVLTLTICGPQNQAYIDLYVLHFPQTLPENKNKNKKMTIGEPTEEIALSPQDGVYSHREWFVHFPLSRNCASETERF